MSKWSDFALMWSSENSDSRLERVSGSRCNMSACLSESDSIFLLLAKDSGDADLSIMPAKEKRINS